MHKSFSDYLQQHSDCDRIMLVGPLADSRLDIVEPVIFVDGGSNRRENNIGLSVGDGDSFSGHLDHKLETDKDYSDFAYALSLLGEEFERIEIFGFLGGRRDHELLNLGEIFHFLSKRSRPTTAHLDHTIEAFSRGSWVTEVHGTFSLVAFDDAIVTLSGDCKYAIPKDTPFNPVSSFGLSNEGYGTISLDTNSPLFLFRVGQANTPLKL